MSIEKKYQKLSDIEHVIARPGMYIGSTTDVTEKCWVYDNGEMKQKTITYNPAFQKLFDEVVSNSVDESKRDDNNLTSIKININQDKNEILVEDNGGIPVVIHKDENKYVPEMIFSELRAGSNFNDEEDQRTWVGTNGVGSTVTNIFSTRFKVETADGTNKFTQIFEDNLSKRSEPKIQLIKQNYTKITFSPDLERLNTTFSEGNYLKLIKRVYDIAGCNPKLRVYLNGEQIKVKSFKDYIQLFTDEDFLYEENEYWKIGVGSADGTFKHISFVNGAETSDGNGSHINYIFNQLVNKMRIFLKKKYKVDVKPSVIKNHMSLYIDATVINPVYSSQTKEKLITDYKEFGTEFIISDKIIKKLLASDVVHKIIEWVEAKKIANEKAELRKLNKNVSKVNPRKIVKLCDANERKDRSKCTLFFAEGDSASKALVSAADKRLVGSYPLKGKPLNVREVDTKKLVANKEFNDIMVSMGLELGVKVESVDQLRYGKIAIMTDSDVDGAHICGLLLNMFNEFWPELIEMGAVYRFQTPLIKVNHNKKDLEFFVERDYLEWKDKNNNPKHTFKYYKGLGLWKTKDFKVFLDNMDKYLIPMTFDDQEDRDILNLLFDKSKADERKTWLNIEA